MKHLKLHYYAFLILTFTIGACNPDGAEYVDELDLVISVKNDTVDFSKYPSYTLADTIIFFSTDGSSSLSSSNEAFILSEVDSRMKENGWTPADSGGSVVLLVSVLENVQTSIYTGWWDYWGGWYGWDYYYPGGGWYYPGYPGGYCCYTSVYTYRKGTLLIEMLDANQSVEVAGQVPMEVPVLWAAGINGLLEGSKANIRNRVESSLDQIFSDSPYLNKN